MARITDKEIMERLSQPGGQRAAFELLVRKYTSQLYWQIRHMVTYHDDANDVLQNTFIKAWTNLDNFRGDAKLSTWLYRIAANESLTFLQRRRDTVTPKPTWPTGSRATLTSTATKQTSCCSKPFRHCPKSSGKCST